MKSTCCLSNRRIASWSRTKAYVESNSYRPSLKIPTTCRLRDSGRLPIGRQHALEREHLHRVADGDAEGCREILAEHDARNLVAPVGETLENSRLHRALHVGDARLERRVDALDLHGDRAAARGNQGLAEHIRRGADDTGMPRRRVTSVR